MSDSGGDRGDRQAGEKNKRKERNQGEKIKERKGKSSESILLGERKGNVK